MFVSKLSLYTDPSAHGLTGVVRFNVSLCRKGGIMKFKVNVHAITAGAFWGAAMLLVSLANLICHRGYALRVG